MIIEKEVMLNTNTTANGRRYTLEALHSIVEQINSRQGVSFGCIGYPSNLVVDLHQASHITTNATIINETLHADIEILSTFEGNSLLNNLDMYVFRPGFMYSGPSEDVVIDAPLLTLVGVFAVPKSEDAVIINNKPYVLNKSNYVTTI